MFLSLVLDFTCHICHKCGHWIEVYFLNYFQTRTNFSDAVYNQHLVTLLKRVVAAKSKLLTLNQRKTEKTLKKAFLY